MLGELTSNIRKQTNETTKYGVIDYLEVLVYVTESCCSYGNRLCKHICAWGSSCGRYKKYIGHTLFLIMGKEYHNK